MKITMLLTALFEKAAKSRHDYLVEYWTDKRALAVAGEAIVMTPMIGTYKVKISAEQSKSIIAECNQRLREFEEKRPSQKLDI